MIYLESDIDSRIIALCYLIDLLIYVICRFDLLEIKAQLAND